jgi:leucyl aminopeptidase (aminopeptidase T)
MSFESMKFSKTSRMIVETCAAVKPGENVVIVTDTNKLTIAESLASACEAVGAETVICIMTPRKMHGNAPPPVVAAAMLGAQVILTPTTYSFSHTDAAIASMAKGARRVTLREVTEDTYVNGAIAADYNQVFADSKAVAELLTKASTIRMTTALGTDITLSAAGRTATFLGGIACPPRMSTPMPAGEGALAPVEGSTEGILVVDHAIDGIGLLSEPVTFTIEHGRVVDIKGGKEVTLLREIMGADECSTNIAEFAIGTNPLSRLLGNVMEDKMKQGCVHIAIGDNHSLGGSVKCRIHLDMVILRPSVWLGGKAIVTNGELII